jgi:hypothetical protein
MRPLDPQIWIPHRFPSASSTPQLSPAVEAYHIHILTAPQSSLLIRIHKTLKLSPPSMKIPLLVIAQILLRLALKQTGISPDARVTTLQHRLPLLMPRTTIPYKSSLTALASNPLLWAQAIDNAVSQLKRSLMTPSIIHMNTKTNMGLEKSSELSQRKGTGRERWWRE